MSNQGASGADLPTANPPGSLEPSDQWQSLVHAIPDLVMVIARDGIVRFSNRAVLNVLPEAMVGTPVEHYVDSKHRSAIRHAIQEVLRTEEVCELDMETSAPEGNKGWYALRVGPFHEQGTITGVTVIATRTTESKRAELALKASEQHFHSLAAVAPVGIFRTNAQRECVYVNQRCCEIMGRSEHELMEFGWTEALHPDDRDRVIEQWQREAYGDHVVHSEHRFIRPDGSIVWVLSATMPEKADDGSALGHVGTLVDITEKKEAEAKLLAEQGLLRKLLQIQEQERQMVSCEIHDGIVQHVVGAKMMVDRIAEEEDLQGTPCVEHAAVVSQALGDAIDEARRLIGELRPMVIDERGIVEAIRYLTVDERFCGGLDVRFQHDVMFDRLESMLEGTIFRIAQEAIINAVRHSTSPSINITLTENAGWLHIEIQDQGIGFDRDKVSPDRFGLRSIEERARLFGGTASIQSKPGAGTRVSVDLPLVAK